MNEFESPLATREKRNNLARRPLHQQVLQDNVVAGSKRTSHGNSPPNSHFTTSSPRDTVDRVENSDDITPGVSYISNSHDLLTTNKSISRRSNRRTTKSFSLEEEEQEEHADNKTKSKRSEKSSNSDSSEESETEQPSGRISFRKVQERGTIMTPGRGRNVPIVQKKDEFSSDLSNFAFGTVFGIAFICLTIFLVRGPEYRTNDTSPNFDLNKTMEIISDGFVSLKNDFPNQPKHTWSILRSSMKSIFKLPSPNQPSVILLVSERNVENVAKCLAKRLDSLAALALLRDHGKHYSGNQFKSKQELIQSIESELGKNLRYLLFDLQHLSGEFAMGLHAFTDNDNAPMKRAVLIFTLECSGFCDSQVDLIVEKELKKSWSSLDEDRISPLLSRIAVSAVRVDMENDFECK